MMQSHSTEKAY